MKEIKTLLAALPLDDEQFGRLKAMLPGAEFIDRREAAASRADVLRADAIFGNVDSELIRGADNLNWIQLASAGSDLYAATAPKTTLLTNSSGAYGEVIAEFILAGVMALQKRLLLYRDNMREGKWENRGGVKLMSESVCLVLGLGDIGGGFARRARALGSYVIGVRRSGGKPDYVDEVHTMDELASLLPRADVIAMSLPNSSATKGIINAGTLALMKPDAILVNVGRGGAVVLDDLLGALQAGKLGGAVLDVTDPEPLPPDHPLWRDERVLITPHCSGNWSHPLIMRTVMNVFEENLEKYRLGQPLKNLVDRKTGYRIIP